MQGNEIHMNGNNMKILNFIVVVIGSGIQTHIHTLREICIHMYVNATKQNP